MLEIATLAAPQKPQRAPRIGRPECLIECLPVAHSVRADMRVLL